MLQIFFGTKGNGTETCEYKQSRMTPKLFTQDLSSYLHRQSQSAVPSTTALSGATGYTGSINSISHPDAWAFLNRICSQGGRPGVPQSAIDDWNAKGTRRSRLLRDFVTKCYQQGAPQNSQILKLEAWIKIKQMTKEWRKSLVGFEYHTEESMKTELKWSEFFGCNFRLPCSPMGEAACFCSLGWHLDFLTSCWDYIA